MINLVSVAIDSDKCAWYESPERKLAFLRDYESKLPPYPLLDFCVENNSDSSTVMTAINGQPKWLFGGIDGPPPEEPKVLKPLEVYDLRLITIDNVSTSHSLKYLSIPKGQAARFQVRVLQVGRGERSYVPRGRIVLKLWFEFSKNLKLIIPTILLNTTTEKEGVTLQVLT